jgi:hypothetical protein
VSRQCRFFGYNPEVVLPLLGKWWYLPSKESLPAMFDPDLLWRKVHGRDPEHQMLAHIALRFITLGTREADVERLLSRQRAIQGQHETNSRTDMLHARFSLHVNRKIGKS